MRTRLDDVRRHGQLEAFRGLPKTVRQNSGVVNQHVDAFSSKAAGEGSHRFEAGDVELLDRNTSSRNLPGNLDRRFLAPNGMRFGTAKKRRPPAGKARWRLRDRSRSSPRSRECGVRRGEAEVVLVEASGMPFESRSIEGKDDGRVQERVQHPSSTLDLAPGIPPTPDGVLQNRPSSLEEAPALVQLRASRALECEVHAQEPALGTRYAYRLASWTLVCL